MSFLSTLNRASRRRRGGTIAVALAFGLSLPSAVVFAGGRSVAATTADVRTIDGDVAFDVAAADTMMPAATAAPNGRPTAAEQPFVKGVMSDLQRRFATTAAAERAGFLRYTDEDATGAISYANRKWTSADPQHPSQLWYDVNGRLLGADFSVLKADSPQPPQRWGVDPARWGTFDAHVHLGLRTADGTIAYKGIGQKTIESGGGTLADPTAAALVKAGVAPDVAHVAFVFPFPAIWDLTVWVLPNPAGAFADANPNVHPVHPKKEAD